MDIITIATDYCPCGINIPNYDDIRENLGFKNVYLNNSSKNYFISSKHFSTEEQRNILDQNHSRCQEIFVGGHELLGHGSGKLIYRSADGTIPYTFVDPLTGENFQSCYEQGEDWNGKFGDISCAYEECRADTCSLYLCTIPQVCSLFGFNPENEEEIKTMLWVNVMNQVRRGVAGLSCFNVEMGTFGEAHRWGEFVSTLFLYENQTGGPTEGRLLKFEVKEDEFLIHLDKELLWTEGREVIRKLLVIL